MSVDTATKYAIGDLVKLTARFQDPATGAYLQPDAVNVEVMDPAGTVTEYMALYASTLETPDGVVAPGYFAEVDVETPGQWYFRFAATGRGQGAQEGGFYVEHSAFADS